MGQIEAKPSILTCQIIAGALIMGVVMFAGFAMATQSGEQPAAANQNELPVLLIVACVFTVMELVVRQVMFFVFDNKLKQQIEDHDEGAVSSEKFLELYQTRLVITMALLEGGGFLGVIVYLVEGHWGGLAIAGFLVTLMAFSFPTENKFRDWIRKNSGQSAYAGDESL